MARSNKTWRWGIMATGGIADLFCQDLALSDRAEIYAVASRDLSKAESFARPRDNRTQKIQKSYGCYEAMANDPNVDIIYIATPHSHHFEAICLCLNAGKHVLCEKPITLNAAQAQTAITLAREKNLFLMEAVWMRFLPAIQAAKQRIDDGQLGNINYLSANFLISKAFDPSHRLYNPSLGGGALLDLGIYPLSFATFMLGHPDKVDGYAHLGATGIDEINHLSLTWHQRPTPAIGHLSSSMRSAAPSEAIVVGEKDSLKIHHFFHQGSKITYHLMDKAPVTKSYPLRGQGYIYEIDAVHDCLDQGLVECSIMPLDESLAMMKIMDQLRFNWGLLYPQETALLP